MVRRSAGRVYDRDILRLAVPALGALTAEPLYVLVDTAVIGHVGTSELGGLAIAGTVLTTSFWLCNFLAYGTTAAVARHIGAGDRRGAAEQLVQALWLAAAVGLLVAAAGLLLGPLAIDLVGAPADVRPHALTYLFVSLAGAPAVLAALACAGYLRGVQDTRTTFAVAVGSNVANLALEILFIFGFGWGVAGSAAATVVAQWGAAAAYVLAVRRTVARADDVDAVRWRPDLHRIRRLVVTGRDLLVRTGSLLACLAVATAVASRLGSVPLAAHHVAFQVWSFLALVLDAIAIAAQALVGRLLGGGDAGAARAAARRMLQWGVGCGVALGLAVAVGRPLLAPVFSGDVDVRREAFALLLVVAVLQPVNAVVFVLDGVLIGAGDARYLALAMAAAALLAYAPAVAAVVVTGAGLLGLWGAICVLMGARLVGLWLRFVGPRWEVTGAP